MSFTRSSVRLASLRHKLLIIEAEISENKEDFIRKKEDKVISRIKSEPKEFYRYAKSKSQAKSVIGPLKKSVDLLLAMNWKWQIY